MSKFDQHAKPINQDSYTIEQNIQASEQRVIKYINQRFWNIEQRLEINEQMLNRFYEHFQQELEHNLNQLNGKLQRIEAFLYQQQGNHSLSIEEKLKDVLLEYRELLEHTLHQNRDELVKGYLSGIQENINHIAQNLPEQSSSQQPTSSELVAQEIKELKNAGHSWSAIAKTLNTNGTPTASGTGKWYGSSVKKYLDHCNSRKM
ncbi:hypothetical protein TI03_01885 [Achromatium sp. WMS1]|nr:hypothetical protein TI03_01885 [Achromatium sp. WMS1]